MKKKYDIGSVIAFLQKDRGINFNGNSVTSVIKPHNRLSKRQCGMLDFLRREGATILPSSTQQDIQRNDRKGRY